MGTIKKLVIDVVLAGIFLILSLVISVLLTEGSGSTTAGAKVTITLWFIFVFALQPVIWNKPLTFKPRLISFIMATVSGVILYLCMGYTALYLLVSGYSSFALRLGNMSDIIAFIVALFVSKVMIFKYVKTLPSKDTKDSSISEMQKFNLPEKE